MPVPGVSPGSVAAIAAGGIRKGYAQLAHAADTIVRATTSGDGDSVSISDRARQVALAQQPDLIDGLVELRSARFSVVLNAGTLRAADEMARAALRIAKRD